LSTGETWDVEVNLRRTGRDALELRPRCCRCRKGCFGATVVGYRELGVLVELRAGSNGQICLADSPGHVIMKGWNRSASPYSLSGAPGSWNPETNEVTDGRPPEAHIMFVPRM
jgi:hypothetical protein